MSAVSNAVHVLLEVAAGRQNLTGAQADDLHEAIDSETAPAAPSEPEPDAGAPASPEVPPAATDAPGAAQEATGA